MAKIRRMDSKAALAQQRATLGRGARGKTYIGDDTGSVSARAAEREKVHRMQETQRAQQAAEERRTFLEDLRRERQRAAREAEEARRDAHLQEPLSALFGELIADSLRLARTFVRLPFRVVAALRHHRPVGLTHRPLEA